MSAPALPLRLLRWSLGQVQRLQVERVVLVTALLGGIVLALVETAVTSGLGVAAPLAFALAVLHAGSLPAAARAPNLAAPLSLGAVLVLQALTEHAGGVWPWPPVFVVTQSLVLAAVATRTTLPIALLHWLLAVGASASLGAWLRPDSAETGNGSVIFGGISAGAIVVALLLAQWRRVRTQLLQERRIAAEEAAGRLLAEERTRIARELHDVVAHSLSIITVQSSTARFRHPDFGDGAATEFDRIAAQSRQALDEMRGLLRVLRGSGDDAERRPQPGIGDVAELVAQAGTAGTAVTLDEPAAGWADDVGPLTGLTAFRIVQEATSNALRHAPGAAVAVRLGRIGNEIEVAVVNASVPGAAPAGALRHGHGLVGMRERAASAGGSVRFGATPDGGYAVHAVLPAFAAIADAT